MPLLYIANLKYTGHYAELYNCVFSWDAVVTSVPSPLDLDTTPYYSGNMASSSSTCDHTKHQKKRQQRG